MVLHTQTTKLSSAAAAACGVTLLPAQKADAASAIQTLLEEAYLYAFPLVLVDATKTVSTNTKTASASRAPVNQFIHARKLLDASSRTVVSPNVDTIYTQAWLDVSAEPQIYVVPEADRFFNVQVLDAWTNTAAVLEAPGAYAIAYSSWEGTLPEGVRRIDIPTRTVWTIARIMLSGPDDLPNVAALQGRMQLMPLSAYPAGLAAAPEGSYSPENDFVPVQKVLAMTPQEFFDTANRDFPGKDFNSEDLTVSCFRYIPTEEANAAGRIWTDPRSGEIIQADILWYHNVVRLLQEWRFIQTAAADPSVRNKELSEEVMGELIRYAVAHETGHALGMKHNMRASFAYPVDSLRSPSFTQKYGTTASIMDYARNNYVAQPGDLERGVKMTPPLLGPFDYFSVQWAYTPIFDAETPEEDCLP